MNIQNLSLLQVEEINRFIYPCQAPVAPALEPPLNLQTDPYIKENCLFKEIKTIQVSCKRINMEEYTILLTYFDLNFD